VPPGQQQRSQPHALGFLPGDENCFRPAGSPKKVNTLLPRAVKLFSQLPMAGWRAPFSAKADFEERTKRNDGGIGQENSPPWNFRAMTENQEGPMSSKLG
jgi:hypothetical protein